MRKSWFIYIQESILMKPNKRIRRKCQLSTVFRRKEGAFLCSFLTHQDLPFSKFRKKGKKRVLSTYLNDDRFGGKTADRQNFLTLRRVRRYSTVFCGNSPSISLCVSTTIKVGLVYNENRGNNEPRLGV